MIKPFKKFIREQTNSDRSGSLERDPLAPIKNKTSRGGINVDPSHRASVLRIAQAILKDKQGGWERGTTVTNNNIGDYVHSNEFKALKAMEDSGLKPSDSMRAHEVATDILSGNKEYIEGIHPDVIRGLRRQANKPTLGQNLDVEG